MVPLTVAVLAQYPEIEDAGKAIEAIEAGRVRFGGRLLLNPRAQVPESAAITVEPEAVLRGTAKLEAAIGRFGVTVEGRTALDAGAAAGGFTTALLAHGVARVYAVDAGHGQLRGELRQSPRVVNLERTNLGELTTDLVPDAIELVTLDLSYISVSRAVPLLERVLLAPGIDLVALVKPMFELGLANAPEDPEQLEAAAATARRGVEYAGWRVLAEMDSPVRGARGAVEFLLHARRQADR
jgi:23S rRNA (cytidine1920-2'-O)/16S rRNA (cytidine1409-2'-O)-methyltransferase